MTTRWTRSRRPLTRSFVVQAVKRIQDVYCPVRLRISSFRPGKRIPTRPGNIRQRIHDDDREVGLADEEEKELGPPEAQPAGVDVLPGLHECEAGVLTKDQLVYEQRPCDEYRAYHVGEQGRRSSVACNHVGEPPDVSDA